MANKKPTPEKTTQPNPAPAAPPTATAGFKPEKVTNPGEYLKGYHVQDAVALTEPLESIDGLFHGEDTPMLMNSGDEIRTWAFDCDGTRIRLRGATVLDNRLEALEKSFVLPIGLRIIYLGKDETKEGRPVNMFTVGVHPDSMKNRIIKDPAIFPEKPSAQ
jgi:hypothetical protein